MHTTHKELCSITHKEQLHTKAKGALFPEAQAKDLTEHILEGELCQASQRLTLHLSGSQGKVALDAKEPLQSWIKMIDAAVPGKAKDRQAHRPGSPTALAWILCWAHGPQVLVCQFPGYSLLSQTYLSATLYITCQNDSQTTSNNRLYKNVLSICILLCGTDGD